jgi:hypothetical protein
MTVKNRHCVGAGLKPARWLYSCAVRPAISPNPTFFLVFTNSATTRAARLQRRKETALICYRQ